MIISLCIEENWYAGRYIELCKHFDVRSQDDAKAVKMLPCSSFHILLNDTAEESLGIVYLQDAFLTW